MKSDQLDISFEEYGKSVLISLSGNFFLEQVAGVRDKIQALLVDGNRDYIINIDKVKFRNAEIVHFFIELLNEINGRGGRLVLLYSHIEIDGFFKGYQNIFERHSSLYELERSGFLKNLKRTGINYSRKTGIRISAGVALVFFILLSGWLLTLFTIIQSQDSQIYDMETQISQQDSVLLQLKNEISEIHANVGPLIDLGFINDSLYRSDYDDVEDWVEYLGVLERRRHKRKASETESVVK